MQERNCPSPAEGMKERNNHVMDHLRSMLDELRVVQNHESKILGSEEPATVPLLRTAAAEHSDD